MRRIRAAIKMIEVIFLGTSSAIPGPGGSNAAYLLRLGSETLLIDCGPAILQQLDAVGVSPREISHVFFTHRHGDHALGFPMLMLWYELNPSPSIQTPVLIGSTLTLEALEQLMLLAYSADLMTIVHSAPKIALPVDAPGSARIHPNIMLTTLPMAHGDFAPVLGVRIETRGERLGEHVLAFTGDTGPCDNIAHLAQDADLLVHEANLSARLNPEWAAGAYGHSTAQIAGRNATVANVKHLALTHIGAMYHEQIDVLLAEAQAEFAGRVSAPTSGIVMSVAR
jgi:ribonuclease Z